MKESSKKTCPDCWGSGWEIQFRMPCKPCKGSGKVADNAFLVEGKKETPEGFFDNRYDSIQKRFWEEITIIVSDAFVNGDKLSETIELLQSKFKITKI